jgi:hypothetical protein
MKDRNTRPELLASLLQQGHSARVRADQAAKILGFRSDELTVLMNRKLLKPLGQPAQNGTKWFSTLELLEKFEDRPWLHNASMTVARDRQMKNGRRGSGQSGMTET